MKKFIVSAVLSLACAFTVVAFAGCTSNVNNSDTQPSVSNTIAFGEKYVYVTNDSSLNEYLILNKDGTAQYQYHTINYDDSITSYHVDFKWEETADNQLHFVYVKATYNDDHTGYRCTTEAEKRDTLYYRRGTYSYSKDILVLNSSTGGAQYVRENSRLDVNID